MERIETAESCVEARLDELALALEEGLNADVLSFLGVIVDQADDAVRDVLDSRSRPRRRRLAVLLETPGGFIEVAQRIAETLRTRYEEVDFIVPNHAMSAGTVLVMSGDAIHMDDYAVLGPIDPQVPRGTDGDFVPATGYLVQYERLIEKSRQGKLTIAETILLLQGFDLAELYRYEQARELSITLLKEWLVRYKFKDWTKTATRGVPVTHEMKAARAREIAEILNDTSRWHSHARGLSIRVVRDVLRLQVEDFGREPDLRDRILSYYRLLRSYRAWTGAADSLHTPGSFLTLNFDERHAEAH